MTKASSLLRVAPLIAFASVFALTAGAQTIPTVKAKALDNSEATLPPQGGQRPLILVVGFSRKSGQMCAAWGKRVAADFRNDSRLNYFQIPVLEDAPSFVRPMIVYGMRKGTPPEELPHMIPVYEHESEWKNAVRFSNADDAYILLTDAQGHIIWQTHGAMNDSSYGELKSVVNKLVGGGAASSSSAKP